MIHPTLFAIFEEKKAAFLKAKQDLQDAERQKSNAIREILAAAGGKKTLAYKGKTLTICHRAKRDLYYFKGDNDDIVEVGEDS